MPIRGHIQLAGDKSLSHRAVIFAGLAEGRSFLRNLSRGADVATTRAVMEALGVVFEMRDSGLGVNSPGIKRLFVNSENLYCGNSGTTLRLSLGILAGSRNTFVLSGDESLNRRPVKRVTTPLNQMGGRLTTVNDGDTPPVMVQGRTLHGIEYVSPVASAQVKSAVLLAALSAEGKTQYDEPTISRDHTERFLISQGAAINITAASITVTPPITISPFKYDTPGDISTAAFFIVAALLLGESKITIHSVLLNETRTGALDILRAMGANITIDNCHSETGEPIGDITVESSQINGIDAGCYETARFIDEIPILAVAAMFASGETIFRNIAELRVKESDRAQGIVDMLACYGCHASIEGDALFIQGGMTTKKRQPDHRGDHRLAMAIEIVELITINKLLGAYQDVVSISAPEFYDTLKNVIT
jgi:3-phosphoshikimate 1-carboxyvinyltransferase